jgi:predicted ATPase
MLMTPASADDRVFRSLSLQGWRQFGQVDLELHPRVTLLTGANASGKTTVLSLLARHFNWPRQWVGIPIRNKDGTFAYFRSFEDEEDGWHAIGQLTYGDGTESSIQIPREAPNGTIAARYDVMLRNQQQVNGLYLTSHRNISSYTQVSSIPASFGSAEVMFSAYTSELRNRYTGGRTAKTPFALFKESLISAAVFGEGSESVERDPLAYRIWHGFQRVMAAILPETLRFEKLIVRSPEVLIVTESDTFPLDEASGGLSALMELSWQIFLRSFEQDRFVVLFDEPENHLHPELQRRILPSLLEAFPQVQFIIASHSPFVVTSVADSTVYVLDYNSNHSVDSRLLDQANKAASADETLRRVLGLQSTMPLWAEQRFEQIVERYVAAGLDRDSVRALREELVESGLGSTFPQAMADAADQQLATRDNG